MTDAEGIGDAARVRALLIEAARAGEARSYSDMLARLGHRFTRPKMRALCRTLDVIDRDRAEDEPALAVLVVRESDGLPGQGWWTDRVRWGDETPWTGPEAHALVRELQGAVFDYWRDR